MRNLSQSDFDPFPDHLQAEIMIVSAISLDFFGCQGDAFVQPARRSLEQPFCCADVSFGYSFLLNQKGLACSIDKVM